MRSFASAALLGLSVVWASACSSDKDTDEAAAQPVAKIGSATITLGELDAWIKDQLFERETENGAEDKLHELRSENLENLISERLLALEAKARGVEVDAMLDQEAAKRVAVGDAEVSAFFEQNKAGLGGRDFESLKDQIRQHLERQAGFKASQAFLAELRTNAKVETLLAIPRAEVATNGPAIGPDGAPVTLVEFSDYQCPYCSRAEPTVQALLKEYAGKLRFVYKHFPLDSMHPLARPASIAAYCAGEQNKFWEYHAQLWVEPQQLDAAALTAKAKATQLDLAKFDACSKDPRATQAVDGDIAAARAAGVSSTPTFFVNGIRVKGAVPLEQFRTLIEKELAGGAVTGS